MPAKKILDKAKKAKRKVKAPTTQAGEFVREEMYYSGDGKRAPRSKKQAAALGLPKAPRKPRNRSAHTYQTADVHPYRDYYADRSQAILRLLEKEERQPEIPNDIFSQYGQEPSRFNNYF